MKVIIIGAGASGLMAALNIPNDYEVILLEKNTPAKKLLQTGAGRCNYWNEEINTTKYNTQRKLELEKIISRKNQQAVLTEFAKLGIVPKIKNGYYYPSSESSQTVKQAFLSKLEDKVTILENFPVTDIKVTKDKFIVSSNDKSLTCDKLIMATGSNASLKEEDNFAYNFLKKTKHAITPLLPALVSLIIKDKTLLSLKGLRIDATLSLIEDNKLIKKETGQLQLTAYGLSGICTFNLSSLVARGLYNGKKEIIKINFLDFLKTDNYLDYFNKRNELMAKPKAITLFETLINYKLVNALFSKEKISPEAKWEDLTSKQKKSLLTSLSAYEVQVFSTNSLKDAQTVSGGVSLNDINVETCESLLVKNLYITGELLDVDGLCGGFNLAFAFITGYLAGRALKDD